MRSNGSPLRRQHQDRDRIARRGARRGSAADVEAVPVRQHQVEQHRGERVPGGIAQRLQARGAAARMMKAKAVLREIGADHRGQAMVVLDHQDALRHDRTIILFRLAAKPESRSVHLTLHMLEQPGPLLGRENIRGVAEPLDKARDAVSSWRICAARSPRARHGPRAAA